MKIQAEIVNGTWPPFMNCGADLRQHINGKISYIPNGIDPKNTFFKLTEVFDGPEG